MFFQKIVQLSTQKSRFLFVSAYLRFNSSEAAGCARMRLDAINHYLEVSVLKGSYRH